MNSLGFLSSLPDASGKSLLRKLGFGYMLSPMVAYTWRIIMQAIPARVIFDSRTQCSNCHSYGHHNNKCINPASCRWCASPHSTGNHTCPTATCRIHGRPCNHSVLRCVNCSGPHDAHTTQCPSRPKDSQDEKPDGDEEEMTT